ncbi:MAG TPA: hypothetical protein VGX03_21910, partial [Candidatus Binatia bacterium]|nr:hypothetical protein [Candidatus Binatia bacterium]
MRKHTDRRFRARAVTSGKRKGSIHLPPNSHMAFLGQLSYLAEYLNSRLLPQDPEEAHMARIVLNLQNILEYEL